jgi:hypothetical protein
MGCGCNKKEKINFSVDIKSQNSTDRTNQIIDRNFGGSKSPADRKRKIAILKRKQKL